MMKGILKTGGTAFSLLSLVILTLPFLIGHIPQSEAGKLVVRGFNMAEFSPWGSIVLLAPIVFLGLAYSEMNFNAKTIGMFALLLLDGFALSAAWSASYEWLVGLSVGWVQTDYIQLLYAVTIILACVCFWLASRIEHREEKTCYLTINVASPSEQQVE